MAKDQVTHTQPSPTLSLPRIKKEEDRKYSIAARDLFAPSPPFLQVQNAFPLPPPFFRRQNYILSDMWECIRGGTEIIKAETKSHKKRRGEDHLPRKSSFLCLSPEEIRIRSDHFSLGGGGGRLGQKVMKSWRLPFHLSILKASRGFFSPPPHLWKKQAEKKVFLRFFVCLLRFDRHGNKSGFALPINQEEVIVVFEIRGCIVIILVTDDFGSGRGRGLFILRLLLLLFGF